MRKKFPRSVYQSILFRQEHKCACGCGELLLPGERVDFDHVLALHLGGEDAPDNLRALKPKHHVAVTTRQAKDRAKVARIRLKQGLKSGEKSAKARTLARIQRYRDMP